MNNIFKHKKVLILLAFIILIIILFLSGPRVVVDEKINRVTLPEDLDEYLYEKEKKFTDITPGAEKTIIWARKNKVLTEISIVYIHGFSATRRETSPLSETVAKRLNANLYYTRLAGHGRTGEAMLDGSVNAWLNDICEAYEIGRRLGEHVVMIGVSTGGTGVIWLASQPWAEKIFACILISPNFGPANKLSGILTFPWGRQIAELIEGKEHSWKAQNPDHERYWISRYPTAALLPMMGLVKLVGSLDLGRISSPALVIYSPKDRVVDPAATLQAYEKIGSERKKIIAYTKAGDEGQHVLAGDILSPESTDKIAGMIIDFLK